MDVALRSHSTIKSSLLKKRPEKAKDLGVVYRIPCTADDCNWSYVGESGRTVQKRMREHKRAIRDLDVERSEVARHVFENDHAVDVSKVEVVDREPRWRRKESD